MKDKMVITFTRTEVSFGSRAPPLLRQDSGCSPQVLPHFGEPFCGKLRRRLARGVSSYRAASSAARTARALGVLSQKWFAGYFTSVFAAGLPVDAAHCLPAWFAPCPRNRWRLLIAAFRLPQTPSLPLPSYFVLAFSLTWWWGDASRWRCVC